MIYLVLLCGRALIIQSSYLDDAENVPIYPVIMTVLWYAAAAITVFALVWATIGIIWINRADGCNDGVVSVC